MKTPRNPSTLHAPLAAYSHQIEITYRERQLVMAGQVGMNPDGTVPDDPIEQLGVGGGRGASATRLAGGGSGGRGG
jgi:2-iminobutanoate/2-iminopropanoate deaminase